MPWSLKFHDPIIIEGRKPLRTLRDAAVYITALPAREQKLLHWQAAAEAVLLVGTKGGDPMLAEIGVRRALNYGKVAEREPRRKRVKVWRIVR